MFTYQEINNYAHDMREEIEEKKKSDPDYTFGLVEENMPLIIENSNTAVYSAVVVGVGILYKKLVLMIADLHNF